MAAPSKVSMKQEPTDDEISCFYLLPLLDLFRQILLLKDYKYQSSGRHDKLYSTDHHQRCVKLCLTTFTIF